MVMNLVKEIILCLFTGGGHGDAVVTHLRSSSDVCSSNPGPYVGNLVVPYRLLAAYSTEPCLTVCTSFLCP